MKYQLSAGCGHGGLCSSTSAGSGFKEKNIQKKLPFFQHKKDSGLRLSLLWHSTDLTERGHFLSHPPTLLRDWFITTETALVPCMQDIGSTTSPQLPYIHSGASNLLIRQSLREYHSVSFRPWAGTTCGSPSGDFVGQLTDCKWLWGALPRRFHPSAASNKTNC